MHVVGVHPAAGSGICGGVADGKAVLDHVLTVLDGLHGHLVALRNVLQSSHRKTVHFHQRALGNGVQGNDHVVDGADMNSCGIVVLLIVSHKGLLPKAAAFVVRVGWFFRLTGSFL